jgi:hypothetical protein
VPLESLLPSGPGLSLAQTASAPWGVQPPSSGQASSPGRHCQDASHGIGRRSVSSIGCPPIRDRRPDPAVQPSGVRPVRCPVTWVRRPGVRRSGRLLSTRPVSTPSSVRPCGVHPSNLQPAGVRPVGPDASVSSHTGRWRWDQVGAAGARHHGNGLSPGGLPRRRAARSTAQQAWTRAVLPRSRVGRRECWWRTRARCGAGGGACPLRGQASQAGVRSAVANGGAVGTG